MTTSAFIRSGSDIEPRLGYSCRRGTLVCDDEGDSNKSSGDYSATVVSAYRQSTVVEGVEQ